VPDVREDEGGSAATRRADRVASEPQTISAHGASGGLHWALRSDVGRRRTDNEDFVGVYAPSEPQERGPLFVLADGMGGHAAGEVASRLAVEGVLEQWTSGPSAAPRSALRSAVRAANSTVFAASLDNEHRGMGTTLTALALLGSEAIIAHVGDSRAYRVRGGLCSQLTDDHSRVGEMLRMRLISPEQAAHHPARSQLTRSLGHEPAVQVDLVRSDVAAGDTFVLCCDGLWDLVPRADIASAVAADADGAAARLLELALERDAPDNVSVIVAHVAELSEQPVAPEGAARGRGLFGFLRR
jgi:protein phosphatase